jgi:hypothetical protein
LASNVEYEIPIVYINGMPMADKSQQFGLTSNAKFYANPINITLASIASIVNNAVQCISLPAMEEAEIYGSGVERGRSMNLYVIDELDDSANAAVVNLIVSGPENATRIHGSTVQLVCLVLPQTTQIEWLKGKQHEV